MNFHFDNKEHSDAKLNKSISGILEKSILCSIATLGKNNTSYIHTAYFAFNEKLELYFLSDPHTQHCVNIENNPSVAVAVSDSRQVWQKPKQGLQLFGTCQLARRTSKISSEYNYIKRFVGYRDWMKILTDQERKAFTSKFYIIKVDSVKIFDEPTFGEEVYITLKINRT